jgi:hypothetical protein
MAPPVFVAQATAAGRGAQASRSSCASAFETGILRSNPRPSQRRDDSPRDCPENRVSLAQHRQMGPTVRAGGANRDRAKAELSKLFSGLSAASLGGGVHRGPTSVRRNQTPRLRRQLLQLGAIVGEVATHRRRRAASHRHAYGPSRRSDDRLVDLADRRGCALHQTARLPESGTSGENRGA